MTKTILITGGFGYLGSILASELQKEYKVILFDRQIPNWANEFFKKSNIICGDVLNIKDCIKATKNIDIVIHCAAITDKSCECDIKKALAVNGEGTYNMLKASTENKISNFIYISTFHIYGPQSTTIINENVLPNPVNMYAISHRLAELFCEMFSFSNNLKTTILRLSNIYGAPIHKDINRWNLVPNAMCKQAFENQEIKIFGSGAQERNFLSTNDLLNAVKTVLFSKEKHAIFDVGGNNILSINKLAKNIKNVYEQEYNTKVKITHIKNFKDNCKYFKYNINKIKKLGYKPSQNISQEILKTFKVLKSS